MYAPNEANSRHIRWEELLALNSGSQVPWCVGGDFNEIRCISERVGRTTMERGMRDFRAFCTNMELVDLPMFGRKFTWTNFRDQAIHSRLDKFLLSQQ